MKLLQKMKKIPGGVFIIPMFIGALINTFCPEILQIGSYTTGLFSKAGANTLVGLTMFYVGTQTNIKDLGKACKRGGVLLLSKVLCGFLMTFIVIKLFGYAGVFGVSALAVLSAMTNSNGSLYMALMDEYGDNEDQAARMFMNIGMGPLPAMIFINLTSGGDISLAATFSSIVPMMVGLILCNIDTDFRDLFAKGNAAIMPLVGFCLGGTINFTDIVGGGLGGLLLTVVSVTIGAIGGFIFDRFILKRPGYAGVAISSTAGNALMTPALVAAVDQAYEPFVTMATSQIATVVVISAFLTPFITKMVVNRVGTAEGKINGENVVA